jgi:serine/threonine protein kinase
MFERKSQREPAEDRTDHSDATSQSAGGETNDADSQLSSSIDTGAGPSYRQPTPQPPTPLPKKPIAKATPLNPGERIDDFEIVRVLGRGAFGCVYLARQLSLDRSVALKVSANRGSEGRTMARLEHRHIVQVFSESVDKKSNQRLLCMQLVPGAGLDSVIRKLHPKTESENQDVRRWTGAQLLAILTEYGNMPVVLDPSAFKDREALEQMDTVEATTWFGGRLAEALAFAHRFGVLHRDIKPANILVNTYGQPLLADFNISSQPFGSATSREEMFGGTFPYMAPEHIDAFDPAHEARIESVTDLSDLFSLGIVLHELLEGRMAFPMPERATPMPQKLQLLREQRRAKRAVCREGTPSARKVLERSVNRCLAPEPGDRYKNASEFAEQLDGCRRLRRIEQQLPPLPKWLRPALRRPFTWLILLATLPQVPASIVNFLYNFSDVIHHTENDALHEFNRNYAIGYNIITYIVATILITIVVRPVWRCWSALEGCEPIDDEQVAIARRKALRIPLWFAGMSVFGWYVGGLVLPPIVNYFIPQPNIRHFMLSHLVSGLIALAYSLCATSFVVLRVLYPKLWSDTRELVSTAREELAPMRYLLTVAQSLAASVPLAAATILVVERQTDQPAFVWLTTALITMGLVGFVTATTVVRRLEQIVQLFSKGGSRSPRPEDLASQL